MRHLEQYHRFVQHCEVMSLVDNYDEQVIPISYKRLDMMYKKIGTSDSSSEVNVDPCGTPIVEIF